MSAEPHAEDELLSDIGGDEPVGNVKEEQLPPGEEEDDEEHVKQPCLVCERDVSTSKSLIDPLEDLQWGAERSHLCTECHNPFRLTLKDTVKLPALPIYMSERSKKAYFQLVIGVYCQMRREGCDRVKADKLLERVRQTIWLLKHLGLPSAPFRLTTIAEDAQLPADVSKLVTVDVDGMERLAYFEDVPDSSHQDAMTRPPCDLNLFLGCGVLRSSVPREVELVMARLEKDMAAGGAPAREEDGNVLTPNKKSAGEQKYERFITAVTSKLFNEFKAKTWSKDAYESNVSAFLLKLTTLRQQCAHTDEDDALLQKIDTMERILLHGKAFLRAFRNLGKVVRLTLDKALTLEPSLSKFYLFLKEECHIKPHIDVLLLCARGCFLETFRDSGTLCKALAQLYEEDWVPLFTVEGWPQSAKPSGTPEQWFRKMFYLCLQHVVAEAGDDRPKVEWFHKIAADIMEFRNELGEVGLNFEELHRDMLHVSHMFLAPTGKASAKTVGAAKRYLHDTPRCTLLNSLFVDLPAGTVAMQSVEELLETRRADTVGDQKVTDSMESLQSAPSVMVSQAECQVLRPSSAWDGSVFVVLLSCTANAVEAKRLWSSARCCEAAESLGGGLFKLIDGACEASHATHLLGLTSFYGALVEPLNQVIAGSFTPEAFDRLTPQLRALAKAARSEAVGLTAQRKFTAAYCGYWEQCDGKPNEDWMQAIFTKELAEKLHKRLRFLEAVNDIISALVAFTNPYVFYSPDEVDPSSVEQSDAAGADAPKSFLGCAVQLITKCKVLHESWMIFCGLRWPPKRVYTCEGFKGLPDMKQSVEELQKFPRTLGKSPFTRVCENYVTSSVKAILTGFSAKCELDACLRPGGIPEEGNVLDAIEHCLDLRKLQNTVHLAEQWFANAPQAEPIRYLPAAQYLRMWQNVQGGLKHIEAEFEVGMLMEPVGKVDLADITFVMRHYMKVNVAMGCLSFIHVSLSKEGLVITKLCVSEGVKRALQLLDATCTDIRSELASTDMVQVRERNKSFHFDEQYLDNWTCYVQMLLPTLRASIAHLALEKLSTAVVRIKNLTPDYGHIVSDTVYAKARAQSAIVGFAGAAQLEAESSDLYAALKDLSATVSLWRVKDILEGMESWSTSKVLATTVHNEAKKFLRVRCGCNLVQNKKGQECVDEAKLLLAKGSLPGKLTSALNGVINRRGGGNASTGEAPFVPVKDEPVRTPQKKADPKEPPAKRSRVMRTPAVPIANSSP